MLWKNTNFLANPIDQDIKTVLHMLNILACRIPWTEKPGRLQSMGSQGVGHD